MHLSLPVRKKKNCLKVGLSSPVMDLEEGLQGLVLVHNSGIHLFHDV